MVTTDEYVTAGLRIARELPSAFNVAFFSKKNVDHIQSTIMSRTKAISGVTIGRQDDLVLMQIMAGVYMSNGTFAGDVTASVSKLNTLVIAECLKQVLAGVKSYAGYVRDSSAPYGGAGLDAFQRPVLASTKGSKILPGFVELKR
jgi:hypothetical protein